MIRKYLFGITLVMLFTLPTLAGKVEPGFNGIGGKFGEIYECPFPNEIVKLDGDLNDPVWTDLVGWHFVDHKTGTGPAPNNEDASIKFAAVADDKWFYVALKVTDDKIIAGEVGPLDAWQDDSVEIYIDANHGETEAYETKEGKWDCQITIPATNIGGDINEPDLGGTGQGPTTGTLAAVVKSDVGWNVEAAVPLRSKGKWDLKLKDGMVIGFNVHFNDDDDKGDRDHKLIWSKKDLDDQSWQNTTRFADLVFVNLELAVDPKGKLATKWGEIKR